eukprot:3086537-Prymnesium_polylepis.1
MSVSCRNPSCMRRARSGRIDVLEWRRDGRKWALRIGVELGRYFGDRWPLIDSIAARWSGTGRVVQSRKPRQNSFLWHEEVRRAGFRGTLGSFWDDAISPGRERGQPVPRTRTLYARRQHGERTKDQTCTSASAQR